MVALLSQQFPLWVKSQVVAAISQSRRVLYVGKQTRFGNRGYKTGIAALELTGFEIVIAVIPAPMPVIQS